MNSILKSILDMDKRAKLKKADAENYRKYIYTNIEAEKEAIKKADLEATKKKLVVVEEAFRKGAEKKLKLIAAKNDELASVLDVKRSEKEQAWVEELYQRIITQ